MAVATPTAPSPTRALLREAGELAVFFVQAVAALRRAPRYTSEILRQTAILVRGSTLIMAVMSFLISYSVINFGYYVLRAVSATDYLGVVSGIITPRGTTPLMFGYIFAAKVGCGMVAEIGAMKVNEEIDAYESEGVDPMVYVVATRLVAVLLFLPIAAFAMLVAGTAGDYFAGIVVLQGLSESAFSTFHWGVQTWSDQLLALLCIGALAVTIVTVSCFYGLRANRGPASVGTAAARSLVVSLVLIHLIHPSYLALFYGLDPKIPIGG
ncbi:MAG TPA: ABC transporter permease [Solirubrobacteraceae bacterium]